MKKAEIFHVLMLLCLAILSGCEEGQEELPAEPEPGTAGHYYLLGLDSSDPQEKLDLYNKGLRAIEDKRDTSLVALLDGKIYAFLRLGQNDSLQVWIDSLITTAEMQGDLFYQAKGYYRKSEIFRRKDPEEQFRNAFYSRNLYLKYGDTSFAGRRSLDMANAQLGLGDYPGSQETATEALKYLDHDRDPHYASSAHNVLGLSYAAQGLYSEAHKEYQEALKYAIDRQDSLSFLHNIALLHKDQENYTEAISIFEEIVNSDEAYEDSRMRYRDNYAFTQWLQDSTFSSEKIMLEVLDHRLSRNDREGLIASYSHLSDYYRDTDAKKSELYARKYLMLADSLSYPSGRVAALQRLIPLSEGKAKDNYIEQYLLLSDSLKEANNRLRYQFAKIRFDEERKEREIDLLQAENVTQQLKTDQLRKGTVISSLSTLLILLASGGLFYHFRQRNKREKVRQIYLTENRISRRIHDELANDIYHVMTSLEPVAPSPMVDKLERIYQRTRDFSRENSEIITGEEYLKGLLNMLAGAVPSGTKLVVRGENSVDWNRLKPENKIVVYRVLQEMMVNMKKHSNAKLVALVFTAENRNLKISYSDNGVGTEQKVLEHGNGIKNLKDRLKTIKANAIFETSQKGVKAQFFIPWSS